MEHRWVLPGIVAALVSSGCGSSGGAKSPPSGGGSAGHAFTDGGAWDCAGARGQKLTCQSPGARAVSAAKYDPTRGCFFSRAPLQDFCAVPTYCPGGSGELTCFVSPSGDAYGVYLLYGEETTAPDWHYGAGASLTSTLTDDEEQLCQQFWASFHGVVDLKTNASADDRSLYGLASAELSPLCP